MKIFENTYKSNNGCVLAFGNFDGVHKGHKSLLLSAKQYAKENGLDFGIYTFSDSPKFVCPDHSVLSGIKGRLSLFEYAAEPDFVYLEKFESVRNLDPEDFVEYVIEKFDCRCAFCGKNFHFGKDAAGTADMLLLFMKSKGCDAVIVDSYVDGDKVVSSTLIKELLTDGNIEKANELLDGVFGFSAKVVHGAHLGHKLGFPTINQVMPKELVMPKFGVYSTIVVIDGNEYIGVTNFGIKPTVSYEGEPVAETYIIDYDGDVYGKSIGLFFFKMLREEKKFSSLDELKENIAENVNQTREFFKEYYEKV